MIRVPVVPACLLLVLVLAAPGVADAQDAPARARITYLAAGLAYLDAGRDDGLRQGQLIEVRRSGQVIATMSVSHLASHRAACTIISGAEQLAVGDSVEYARAAPEPRPADSTRPVRAGAGRRQDLFHGRIGVRYLRLLPPGGTRFSQPALDLRLEGHRLGGTSLGLIADVRARRTSRVVNDSIRTVESRNAVYQAALLVQPAGPARLTLGRQYLPTVSSVSLFDGALVEYQQSRFGAGIFAGSEPDPVSMGLGRNRDLGFYLQSRSPPGRVIRWSVSAGAIGSYAEGQVNREFGFLQATVYSPGFTLLAAQEVDLNRGWKADAGEPPVSLTSTYASLSARPVRWLSLQTGLDNRRNVRLYRDFETPEAVFDDSFRQGVWGGIAVDGGAHLRAGLEARAAFGADTLARTRSGTVWLGLDRLTALRFGVRSRHTRYVSAGRTGWLHSAGVTLRPRSWLGLEGLGGHRLEQVGTASPTASWLGANLDLAVGRSVYLFGSWSRETGNLAAGEQWMGSLSWRF